MYHVFSLCNGLFLKWMERFLPNYLTLSSNRCIWKRYKRAQKKYFYDASVCSFHMNTQ